MKNNMNISDKEKEKIINLIFKNLIDNEYIKEYVCDEENYRLLEIDNFSEYHADDGQTYIVEDIKFTIEPCDKVVSKICNEINKKCNKNIDCEWDEDFLFKIQDFVNFMVEYAIENFDDYLNEKYGINFYVVGRSGGYIGVLAKELCYFISVNKDRLKDELFDKKDEIIKDIYDYIYEREGNDIFEYDSFFDAVVDYEDEITEYVFDYYLEDDLSDYIDYSKVVKILNDIEYEHSSFVKYLCSDDFVIDFLDNYGDCENWD